MTIKYIEAGVCQSSFMKKSRAHYPYSKEGAIEIVGEEGACLTAESENRQQLRICH
jgi:hypothetical protein